MAETIDVFESDDALVAAVITGAGGTFSSGTDLRAQAADESMRVGRRGFYGLLEGPRRSRSSRRSKGTPSAAAASSRSRATSSSPHAPRRSVSQRSAWV